MPDFAQAPVGKRPIEHERLVKRPNPYDATDPLPCIPAFVAGHSKTYSTTGQVVEVNREKLWRPVIKILYDQQGRALDEPRETNLAHNSKLFITKAVTYHELP